jgi:hypothetical protein
MTFDVAAVGAKITRGYNITQVPVELVFKDGDLVFN